jgi:hypothetical protein
MTMTSAQSFGSSFGDELRAAGVSDGVSWGDDGTVVIRDDKDAAYCAKVKSVVDAHQPTGLASQLLAIQQQRAAAYPSIGDQLDAIWKGGPAFDQMQQQVLAVKTQYPKP